LKASSVSRNDDSNSTLVDTFLLRRAALVRFFSARTGSVDEAEDIVQEVFVKISRAQPTEVENPGAYLYRLGINVLVDRRRAASRSMRRDSEFHGDAGETDSAPSPERVAAARLRLEDILRVVEKLPPQCRRVFTLHRIDGQSHAEVAAALGISRSAVEKHMILAIRRLAELDR
jgi:RNA polymerase sigma-70 factor (ECF subfamily)